MSDYPSESDLEKIKNWDYNDFKGLMEFIKPLWAYADSDYWDDYVDLDPTKSPAGEHVYNISTAGWSGNESIISALKDNLVFWSFCWDCSTRGGHYAFRVRINN